MIIFNDRKEYEIRYNLNPIEPGLTDKTRPIILGMTKNNKKVCRFTQWIMIGSFTALGFFDMYLWDHNSKMFKVESGYVEKTLKPVYDGYGKGFPFILTVWNAWTTSGGTSWTVAGDWNNNNNYIDVISGGGRGSSAGFSGYEGIGAGGGGGGYARKNNCSMTKGATVYLSVGDVGQGSWFNITGTNAQPGSSSAGPYATGGQNASGATAGNGGQGTYGNVLYNGGSGQGTTAGGFGGGGGGAAGPNGNGGLAGAGGSAHNSGGGGGNGGGSSATNDTGGNNSSGSGGGASGGGSAQGHDGTDGGGGGGGGSWIAYGGGKGGDGTEYNNGAWGSGGGGAGGYSGGNGGIFGGGGGGRCNLYNGNDGNGRGGLIVMSYTPASFFIPSLSFAGF